MSSGCPVTRMVTVSHERRVLQNPCYTGHALADLTITIDDELLRLARIRALQQGTSVNAVLRDYLIAYAGAGDVQERALADLLELSLSTASRRGHARRTRDELHARSEAREAGDGPSAATGGGRASRHGPW